MKNSKGATLINFIVISVLLVAIGYVVYYYLVTNNIDIPFMPRNNITNTIVENTIDFENTVENMTIENIIVSESNNKTNKINIVFEESDAKEIKIIKKLDSINIVTFGGDVTLEKNNKTYSLEDAFEENVITPEELLNSFSLDLSNKVCNINYYNDGGSREFIYPEYTIIHTNRLDEEVQDLVFAPKNDEISDLFNTYLSLKENTYTGSKYDEGIGISATLINKLEDKLWLIKYDNNEYLIKLDNIDVSKLKIKENESFNMVYSGKKSFAYDYIELKNYNKLDSNYKIQINVVHDEVVNTEENEYTEYETYENLEITEENNNKNTEEGYEVKKIFNNNYWLVKSKYGGSHLSLLVLKADYELYEDLSEGSKIVIPSGGKMLSNIYYLTDVTKVEKK